MRPPVATGDALYAAGAEATRPGLHDLAGVCAKDGEDAAVLDRVDQPVEHQRRRHHRHEALLVPPQLARADGSSGVSVQRHRDQARRRDDGRPRLDPLAFDDDPKTAAAQRKKAFADAAKGGYLVGVAHIAFPGIGRVRAESKGYIWVPANYTALNP